MLYEIAQVVPHRDQTVPVTWSDGARANVRFAPFLEKGGLFDALNDPDYFVREMRLLPHGIGLAWPNEVDFSADGLRQDAFPAEATGEIEEQAPASSDRSLHRQANPRPAKART
jgi:hypothetical protein